MRQLAYLKPALSRGAEPVEAEIEGPPLPNFVLQQPTSLTIDYSYDALNRLTNATYSDGRSFQYAYDPAGNVLELQKNLGPGTVVTTYTYDTANQLQTALENGVTWQYHYDANGSLIETLPDGNAASGAKRYTYNPAGYLTQVETHNGTDWAVQAEMDYNGLGQRLSLDASGVIAHYVMDDNQPLSVNSGGNTTFYLYGKGVIAEKTNDWAYSLPDGVNTPRQLAGLTGEVTLSGRYTPWGDTLDVYGTGNFTFGYLGGMMDLASGLIYVGNGQYYDPSTGRFLTRGVSPNSTNPYIPWNPIGAILGPLALVSLVAVRKRGKHSKAYPYLWMFVMMVVLPLGIGMACDGETPPLTEPVNFTLTVENNMVTATATVAGQTYTVTAPAPTPIYSCSLVIPSGTNEIELNLTLDELIDYIRRNNAYSPDYSAVREQLHRLMKMAGEFGFNTNHLAYLYATVHVETNWINFEETYDSLADFNKYEPGTGLGKQLGNTLEGDGYLYRGRGFIHLTGRGNYRKASEELALYATNPIDGSSRPLLEDFPSLAGTHTSDYDYSAHIAVEGMKEGWFTSKKLSDFDNADGTYDFYGARAIINWPDAQGGDPTQRAGALGIGFAEILSRHCPLGGTETITCVVCK